MADNLVLGFILGVTAYVALDIGKGIQKYAIEGFKGKSGTGKNTGIWAMGTVLTTSFMFISWAALFFAPINVVAPLEGIGLVCLLIFSRYVLKESIGKIELVGITLVIVGIATIAGFNPNTGGNSISEFNVMLFWGIVILLVVVEGTLFIVTRVVSRLRKFSGIAMACIAGTVMAFQTVTKRISAIPEIGPLYSAIMLGFAVATLALSQVALTLARVNVVVSCFTSLSILLATVVGVVAIGEFLVAPQIAAIGVLLAGVLCLTAFRKEEKITNANKSL